ncbi:hypothetical protein [Phenylobacterium sp.]|uniref:hypothetical protein n=1 Tax=Phenylobacterium sp. TaxID=1871053 RepID=UPI002E38091A|nr:hypothetical protein [Phenylobacterium sp.]HEX2561655.1 hypothetical protein [Phenylobacterium sp.]
MRHAIFAAALVAAVVGGRPALAAGPEETAPAVADRPAQAAPAQARRLLPEAELSAYNGGQDAGVQVQATQTLTATANGNSIGGDLLSGDVTFSDNALDNFSGVGNVVINTGANSNLQGSILVTVVGAPEL